MYYCSCYLNYKVEGVSAVCCALSPISKKTEEKFSVQIGKITYFCFMRSEVLLSVNTLYYHIIKCFPKCQTCEQNILITNTMGKLMKRSIFLNPNLTHILNTLATFVLEELCAIKQFSRTTTVLSGPHRQRNLDSHLQ